MTHNLKGNCLVATCTRCDGSCDACHEHDEPRGTCLACPTCEACEYLQSLDAQLFAHKGVSA